jgi:hypothetical protein
MGNRNYCIFENTLADLRDCWANWEDPQEELSESEKKAKEKLLKLCREIAEDAI